MKKENSYRQILKATSIFGGVQIFNILINIFRGKIVAVLLGPSGIGFMGLINSTLSLVGALTNFGLSTSAVKSIALSYANNEFLRVQKTIAIIEKLSWYTGIFGVFLTLVFSSLLSFLTFGNYDYTLTFVYVSITLLFNQLTSSHLVVLQGLRKLNKLARASLWGSLIGLIISIPIYYYLGNSGITLSIIVGSIIPFLVTGKINDTKKSTDISISIEDFKVESFEMLKTGLILSLSSLIGFLTSYIIRLFIGRIGNLEQVGLYSAGFAIISTYVNLVFSAMGTDYYPRLTSTISDKNKTHLLINEQAELALIIISPILVSFIVLIKPIIILMYSNSFVSISNMLIFSALSIYFKATFWPVGFLFLSMGRNKLFFYSELISNIYTLIFGILGFYFWGLLGIGFSTILALFINMLQVLFLGKYFFNFSFRKNVFLLLFLGLFFAISSVSIVLFCVDLFKIGFGLLVIIIALFHSVYELNKRVNVRSLLVSKFNSFI